MNHFQRLSSDQFVGFHKKTQTSWTILVFLLIFLPCAADDQPPIGHILASIGNVQAKTADNSERALRRGDPFYSLETIVISAESKAQLKFIDGGIVNLIAQTEYRIDSYIFNESGHISESISTLVKGGFRAISGAIAKENPDRVQVKTALATLGLRGTIFEAVFAHGKVSAGCDMGKIAVTNDNGEIEIGPSSNTLYAIILEGEAPLPSIKKPADLAAVSFDIEGAEPKVASPSATPPVIPQPLPNPQTWPLQQPEPSYPLFEFHPQESQTRPIERKEYYAPRAGGRAAYHGSSPVEGSPYDGTKKELYQGSGQSYQSSGRGYSSDRHSFQDSGRGYQDSGRTYQSSGRSYQGDGQNYRRGGEGYQDNDRSDQGGGQSYHRRGGSSGYSGSSGNGDFPGGGGHFPGSGAPLPLF